jgi:hypothetical protein
VKIGDVDVRELGEELGDEVGCAGLEAVFGGFELGEEPVGTR